MKGTFRPLRMETWDGEPTDPHLRRSRWTFKAGWHDTLNMLDRELDHLGATTFAIEADFREADIRLDGLPRSNARAPQFPGVRIAFESRHGPLVYQADSCVYWQHNVRSIALGLGALRKVDLYGISRRAEQYTGWKALPTGSTDGGITADDAAALLLAWSKYPQFPLGDDEQRRMVRAARGNSHPDRHDGDHSHWNMVEGSIRFLRATGALA